MEITEVWGCLLHRTLQYMGMMKDDQLRAEEEKQKEKEEEEEEEGD